MGHYNWGELGLSHISLGLWGYVGRPLEISVDVSVLVLGAYIRFSLQAVA